MYSVQATSQPRSGFLSGYSGHYPSRAGGFGRYVTAPPGLMQSHVPARPKRLHVSNIPFKMNTQDLEFLFRVFGPVSEVEIITNSKGSKGFGFVTYARAEHADEAKRMLHHTAIDGRRIEVNDALPRNRFSIVPSDALMQNPDWRLKELSLRHTVVAPNGDLVSSQRQRVSEPMPVPSPGSDWYLKITEMMAQRRAAAAAPLTPPSSTISPTGSSDDENEYQLFFKNNSSL